MHDILFHIRFGRMDLPIHSYGVMIMIGFLLGLFVARWRARKVGMEPDHVTDLAIWALLGGIAGARILYIIEFPREFNSIADLFKIWKGGLVFYGGLIGAAIAAVFIIKRRRLQALNALDVLIPSVALGQAFGRIGCFLRGCCYGVPVSKDAWYGVIFPSPPACDVYSANTGIAEGTPLFPSQLVSSLNLLALFVILTLYWRHRRRMGDVFALYLILEAIQRFAVEFYRGDHTAGQLSPAQWVALVMFFAGLALYAAPRPAAAISALARTDKDKRDCKDRKDDGNNN